MFAVLGTIEFQVVGSPESLKRDSKVTFPEHKVVENKPKLQFTGPELDEVTIDLQFHQEFTNPRAQRNAIYAARDAHQALALVFGNGEHWGSFVIVSASETHKWNAADGTPVAIAMSLVLKEWVPDTNIDPAAPPTPATPPLGLAAAGAAGFVVAARQIVDPKTGAPVLVFTGPAVGTSAITSNPQPAGNSSPDVMPDDIPVSTIVRASR
jgi:phage protein U